METQSLINHMRSIRKGSYLRPNPFKWFPLRSESFEELKGVGDQITVSWSALLHQHPVPTWRHVILERISAKDHGEPKCPSVLPFEILHSEGPFEVDSFEHFCLKWPFNMAAMIVFTRRAKYPVWNAPIDWHNKTNKTQAASIND